MCGNVNIVKINLNFLMCQIRQIILDGLSGVRIAPVAHNIAPMARKLYRGASDS